MVEKFLSRTGSGSEKNKDQELPYLFFNLDRRERTPYIFIFVGPNYRTGQQSFGTIRE